jgi:hypothetical protein
MRQRQPGLPPLLVVVALLLLGAAEPAWAHSGLGARTTEVTASEPADARPISDAAPLRLTLSAAPDASGPPWPAILGVLAAVVLAWRRPRRALILAMVLLLAIFAFEDGLHSVHHLAERSKLNPCAIAVATAHLNATAVDDGATVDIVLPVFASLTEIGQTDPVTSFPSPVQGRAPPPLAG